MTQPNTKQLLDDTNFPFLAKYKNLLLPDQLGAFSIFCLGPIGVFALVISFFVKNSLLSWFSIAVIVMCLLGTVIAVALYNAQKSEIAKYHNVEDRHLDEGWYKNMYEAWKSQENLKIANAKVPESPFDILDDSKFPLLAKYKYLRLPTHVFLLMVPCMSTSGLVVIVSTLFHITGLVVVILGVALMALGLLSIFVGIILMLIQDKQLAKFHPQAQAWKEEQTEPVDLSSNIKYYWDLARTAANTNNTKVNPVVSKAQTVVSQSKHVEEIDSASFPKSVQDVLTVTKKKLKEAEDAGVTNVEDEHFLESSSELYLPEMFKLYKVLPERVKQDNSDETILLLKNLGQIQSQAERIIAESEEEKITNFKVYGEFIQETLN